MTREEKGSADDRGDRGGRAERDDSDNAPAGHGASVARNRAGTVFRAMPTYRELLAQLRSEIDEVDAVRARELLAANDPPLLIDIREFDEWQEGRIPGAILIPRGNLESRIEQTAPDKSRPIVLYCAQGNRTVFGAKTLGELGYTDVVSMAGGYTDWKRNGFDTELPGGLDETKRARYSRHLLIPEVGEEGQ